MRLSTSVKKAIGFAVFQTVRVLKEDISRMDGDTNSIIMTTLQWMIASDKEREEAGLAPLPSEDEFLELYSIAEKDIQEKMPELFQKRIIITQ